jgi:DNA-directed RNA polymerase specialized sigma24 family protein
VALAQSIAKHLPFLRRYARALTGSQSSGDAYVASTLEALIKDPGLLKSLDEPRVALFRLFTSIWDSMPLNRATDPVAPNFAPEQRLRHLTPRPRQAFLLLSLEGFSEQDTAHILNVDVQSVRSLVGKAGRELAEEIATDVLIIEDEAFIALDLEVLVENLGHRVVGIARTHAEAVAIAKTTQPGLILADIQLADGSSGPPRKQTTKPPPFRSILARSRPLSVKARASPHSCGSRTSLSGGADRGRYFA